MMTGRFPAMGREVAVKSDFAGADPCVACHVFPYLCHIRKSHVVVITCCHVFPHLCHIRKSHVVVITCCHVFPHLCISVNHMLL